MGVRVEIASPGEGYRSLGVLLPLENMGASSNGSQ